MGFWGVSGALGAWGVCGALEHRTLHSRARSSTASGASFPSGSVEADVEHIHLLIPVCLRSTRVSGPPKFPLCPLNSGSVGSMDSMSSVGSAGSVGSTGSAGSVGMFPSEEHGHF